MNNYKKWQTLNESLGFPLGVKSTASLGIVGGYGEFLDEAKKKMKGKKKFNGDVSIGGDDADISDDDDDDDIIDINGDDDDDDDEHMCKCKKPDLGDIMGGDDDDDGEEGVAPAIGKGGPPMKFMKGKKKMKHGMKYGKKCMKCKMKVKMKKKMKSESVASMTAEEVINEIAPLMAAGLGHVAGKLKSELLMKKNMKKDKKKMPNESTDPFGSYYSPHNDQAELGSKEYAQEFYKSLGEHFGNPNEKFDSGVDLGEEVIFKPRPEEDSPVWQAEPQASEPQAGEPGFAPVNKVGGNLGGEQTPARAEWEQQWSPISDQISDQ